MENDEKLKRETINGQHYIFTPWAAFDAVERMAWVYKTYGSQIALIMPMIKNLIGINPENATLDDILESHTKSLGELASLSGSIDPQEVRQVLNYLLEGVHTVFSDGSTAPADESHFNKYPADLFQAALRSAIVQFTPFLPGGVRNLFRKKPAPPSPSPKG